MDLLLVELLTTHAQRGTPLVKHLVGELEVDVRQEWRPDAAWLANYQKCQLTNLLSELLGPVYVPATEQRKKTELVEAITKLFTDAADDKLEDKALTERVNSWLPSNLRPAEEAAK